MKRTAFYVLACLAAAGCSTVDTAEENGTVTGTPAKEIVLTKVQQQITSDVNSFGLDVFRTLAAEKPDENILISPLSLSLALSMAATGADGQTLSQMKKVLGFEDYSTDELDSYYSTIVKALKEADESTSFESANSIWAQKGFSFKKSFAESCSKYFDSEARTVDFNSDSGTDEVNSWCSEKTHGKITKILDDGDGLVMLLVNALYFNGIWSKEFETAAEGKFFAIDSSSSKVRFMTDSRSIPYYEGNGWQAIDLAYGNGAFCLTAILPSYSGTFPEAVSTLDSKLWKELDCKRECKVRVSFPEFKMEYEKTLNDALRKLGMVDAFGGKADFSKMADYPLYVDFVKQKAYIDINRKGTEAAAVTSIGMKTTSAGPVREYSFNADRPVIFAIRETSTGAILFIGQKVK